jgi:hypothetical protein
VVRRRRALETLQARLVGLEESVIQGIPI